MANSEYTLQTRNGYSLVVEYGQGASREPVIVQYDVRGAGGQSQGKFLHLYDAEAKFDLLAPGAPVPRPQVWTVS
ncbi:MAG TPA: hypothetical protein VF472_11355 [Burkholderiaceae bacterium]